jgi:hypothetical protein
MVLKELVKPINLTISEKKKALNGQVNRVAVFARTKVVETFTNNGNLYLIYYKDKLIYGEQLDELKQGSFIDLAMKEGLVFESQHAVTAFLIPKLSIKIPNKNTLFTRLQDHYSPQEVAYIATTLDSFFTEDVITKSVNEVFTHLKRNGQHFKAFQVMHLLNEQIANFDADKDLLKSIEFQKYADFYKTKDLRIIAEKDPLFMELHCFQGRSDKEKAVLLEEMLHNQNRLFEAIIIWISGDDQQQIISSIKKNTEAALKIVSKEQWILILSQADINPFQALPEAEGIIKSLILEGKKDQAANYLLNFIDNLPSSYHSILYSLWFELDPTFITSYLDKVIYIIKQQEEKSSELEKKFHHLILRLLKEHDLVFVQKILLPLTKEFPYSLTMKKINRMCEIIEDPDQMMELGQYYAEFNQIDKALECFFWEMEVKPEDPNAAKQISKMYQQKGMIKEATAYQQMFSMLKRKQTG